MKGKAYNKYMETDEEGNVQIYETVHDTVFDHSEVFSFTTINGEDGEPEFIEIITKRGVSCQLVYEENLIIDLAQEFRRRNAL